MCFTNLTKKFQKIIASQILKYIYSQGSSGKFHAHRMLIRYIEKSMENSESRHFESKMQREKVVQAIQIISGIGLCTFESLKYVLH